MRALAMLACACACAGTLGRPGHRAPDGVAFCEPTAVTVDRGDADRRIDIACHVGGRVTRTEGGVTVAVSPEDAAHLWDVLAEIEAVPSCAERPGDGPMFAIAIVRDDHEMDLGACQLGADPRFDRVLGAVISSR